MRRPLAYICAPFGAPTAEERRRNVDRAILLGKLAEACGYTPIVPHVNGLALFGDEDGSAPDTRERAMRWCLDVLAFVRDAGGELWILERDDGSRSDGMVQEVELWGTSTKMWGRWAAWGSLVEYDAPHLWDAWRGHGMTEARMFELRMQRKPVKKVGWLKRLTLGGLR